MLSRLELAFSPRRYLRTEAKRWPELIPLLRYGTLQPAAQGKGQKDTSMKKLVMKNIDGVIHYLDSSSLLEETWWSPSEYKGRDGRNHLGKNYIVLPKNRLCEKVLIPARDWLEDQIYEHGIRFFGIILLMSIALTAICGYGSYQMITEEWSHDWVFWVVHSLTAVSTIETVILGIMFGMAVKDRIDEIRFEQQERERELAEPGE